MVERLTVKELMRLEKYIELAHEAANAEQLIRKHYNSSFGIGNEKIEVYSTESFDEYYGSATLSINGVWHYHDNWHGGRAWDVDISADGIFVLFKEAYLQETGEVYTLEDMFDESRQYCPRYEDATTPAHYFREFIEKIKKESN